MFRADHVICISESTRRDLIECFGVAPEKTSVIHHGVRPLPNSKAPLGEAQLPTARPFLLYVGQRHGYKNFEGLLRAYAGSAALRADFDLVAFGGGAFRPEENYLIDQLGLEHSCVHQLGGADEVLDTLYRRCQLFVYPSLYEGFGLPPLEAMQRGAPVVCLNTSSLPEVVCDAAFLVDPASGVAGLAHALEGVALNQELRRTLSTAGRARAAQFSWSRCAAETLQVYEKVLGRSV